ncbi:MAG: hypothetical protein IAF02_07085 [Anaerolineae bacterium]|nr:hypothetical protein [Anaerolineae bacterium]
MITCPKCQTPNEPNSRFCISCGQVLSDAQPGTAVVVDATHWHRRQLAIKTAQVVITLFLIWFFRSILIDLTFVKGLYYSEFPFTLEEIVTFIAYFIAFILLVGYTKTLRTHWPPAFPAVASLTPALLVVIYVILLSLMYKALLPIMLQVVADPGDLLLALRVILALLAIILLFWAGKVIYDALPAWLDSIHFTTTPVDGQIVCTQCGRINAPDHQFCGYCGHTLRQPPALVEGSGD